jgi:hypothetical protein
MRLLSLSQAATRPQPRFTIAGLLKASIRRSTIQASQSALEFVERSLDPSRDQMNERQLSAAPQTDCNGNIWRLADIRARRGAPLLVPVQLNRTNAVAPCTSP